MEDSDDDVVLLEEVNSMTSKTWKWKAPNPALKAGDTQKILQQVREKLKMKNPELMSPSENIVASGASPEHISNPELQTHSSAETLFQLEKTPQKSAPSEAPIFLTPEQIEELTDNCLDSDNEPSPGGSVPSAPVRNLATPGPKKQLFEKPQFKVSNSIRYRASKYFGAGTSSEDLNEILSEGSGLQSKNISPSKSPSPKKRRLSKHSPIRLLPSHKKLGKSPSKRSPSGISFGLPSPQKSSPGKMSSGLSPKSSSDSRTPSNATLSPNKQTETIAEGPYYYEAFSFMIKKIYEDKEYRHLFLESELRKMSQVDTAKLQFLLYVRLLNRKDKWNRCSDIAYPDIARDLSPLFDYLEMHELISCDLHDERLDMLLQLLKKDEVKTICKEFKVSKTGNKQDLVNALLSMHKSQPTLLGVSPMLNRVKAMLGRCVRLKLNWRHVFRRCILLFSMFHSVEDLDGLGAEQALLLLQVKLKNVTYPVQDAKMDHGTRIFSNRDQLIRFEEARELRQELNNAIQMKNFKTIKDLTDKGLRQFSTLLELTLETKHVLQLPSFLQRFSAGSVYARILTTAIDALRQAQEYEFALKVLNLLMAQNIYGIKLKGEWALKQATLYHVNTKDIIKACNVLCAALKDKSLSSVDRMHLQQRAEKVFKLKKNGLSQEYKAILHRAMDSPSEAPKVVEVSARAMSGSKPGLKKVYIRDTGDGKEFMSVEETVIAHYKSLGFVSGVHDEGSTVSSLCILSLWNHIYDISIPSVFQSPYQIKPLDWASKDFYEKRKNAIDAHFSLLTSESVEFVANYLRELRTKYCHLTSLVNWDRLEHLDIHAFLECMTVAVFVAISRRLIEDWKSHRKGFPDLVVWSPLQKKCFFIEVKSPNDTLSTVQSMWLNFLKKCNSEAFVVHIRESGSKGTVS